MNVKLSAMIFALLVSATALAGAVHAIPTNGQDWVGPRPQDNCSTTQELGNHGSSTGTGVLHPTQTDGTNGYHSYTQGAGVGALDACMNANPSDWIAWEGCAQGQQTAADTTGLQTIGDGKNVPNDILGVQQITDPAAGGGNVYQAKCGGLAGTGSDGEYEWGTNEAILNVRTGAGTEPITLVSAGDGVSSCMAPLASAHHGSDTTIYVQDAALGSYIGFSVYSDWARQASYSADGKDDNTAAGLAHCGDGAFEPCPVGYAGAQNTLTNDPNTPPTNVLDTVQYLNNNLVAPTNTSKLNHDLDVEGGCNPLDTVVTVQPSLAGPGPLGLPNQVTVPGGLTLATSPVYGYGGANGQLTVLINHGPQGACADSGTACAPGLGNVGGHASVQGVGAAPTFGWVWTG